MKLKLIFLCQLLCIQVQTRVMVRSWAVLGNYAVHMYVAEGLIQALIKIPYVMFVYFYSYHIHLNTTVIINNIFI